MGKSEPIIKNEVVDIFENWSLRLACHNYQWLQSNNPNPEHEDWLLFASSLQWAYLNKSMLNFLEFAGDKLFEYFMGLSATVIYLKKLKDPEFKDNPKIIAGIHYLIAEGFYYERMGYFLEELKLDMLTEAVKECRCAITLDPDNLKYRDLLVTILSQGMANHIDALKELERIIELDPDCTTFYGKNARKDISHIKEQAKADHVLPSEAQIPFSAGLAHHRAGRMHEAIKEYQQAIRLAPKYIPAYQYGIPVEIGPNTTYITDYRSYPYMDIGVLKHTLKLNKTNLIVDLQDDIHLCLGLTYIQTGDRKKAIEELKKVVGISPGDNPESLIDFTAMISQSIDAIIGSESNVSNDIQTDKIEDDVDAKKGGIITNWPTFGGNQAHTGQAVDILEPPLRLEWEFSTESYIEASPIVCDNIIYFGTRDKKFYALNATTSQMIWEFEVQGMIMSSAVINDGVVYITSLGDCFYALNAKNGTLIWEYKLPIKSLEQMFISAGSHPLVFNTAKSTFACLPWNNLSFINSINGECKNALKEEISGVSTPAFRDGILYFAVLSHRLLVALDVFSMKEVWVISTRDRVRTGPVISKDMLFYGTKHNVMCGHRIRDGELVWEFPIPHEPIFLSCEGIESSPAVSSGILYFGGPDGWVYAINTSTGKEIWSFQIGSDLTSTPVVSGKNVYVSSTGRNLFCFDIETGAKKWEYETQRGFKSGPIISGNMLYCASNILYAFSGLDK